MTSTSTSDSPRLIWRAQVEAPLPLDTFERLVSASLYMSALTTVLADAMFGVVSSQRAVTQGQDVLRRYRGQVLQVADFSYGETVRITIAPQTELAGASLGAAAALSSVLLASHMDIEAFRRKVAKPQYKAADASRIAAQAGWHRPPGRGHAVGARARRRENDEQVSQALCDAWDATTEFALNQAVHGDALRAVSVLIEEVRSARAANSSIQDARNAGFRVAVRGADLARPRYRRSALASD